MPGRLFLLGRTVGTPAALAAIAAAGTHPAALLIRHTRGDWGDIHEDGEIANRDALAAASGEVLSAYPLGTGTTVWVSTMLAGPETYTTIMLPEER